MKAFWNKIARPACVYFTLMTLIYAAGNYAVYGNGADGGALSSLRVLLLAVFSLILSTANLLLANKKLSVVVRVPIHAAITGLGYLLCLVKPLALEGSGELIGMLIYFVVYAVTALIVALHRNNVAKKNDREAEYTSVFKK